MTNKKILIILIAISWYIVNPDLGGAMGETSDYKTRIKAKLRNIDISDGVNQKEAIIIAQNYLIDEGLDKICAISTGKVVGDLYNNPEYWHVSFSTTQNVKWKQGLKWASVYVSKKTGEAKYGGEGPS